MFHINQEKKLLPIVKNQPLKTSRQELDAAYVLNGALYLSNCLWLQNQVSFYGAETIGYVMPKERSVDIDSPLDWLLAETLILQNTL